MLHVSSVQWWMYGALVCAVLGATSVWHVGAKDAKREALPQAARRQGKPIPVRVEPAQQRVLKDSFTCMGVTAPSQSVSLVFTANVEAFGGVLVTKVHCQEGMHVKEGDVLFEFDRTALEQSVRLQEALAAYADEVLTQMEQVNKKQAATRAELLSARATYVKAKYELQVARESFEQCRIECPIDGVIGKVEVVEGTRVARGQALTRVVALQPLHVEIDCPAQFSSILKPGLRAEVTWDALPHHGNEGRVSRVSPQGDSDRHIIPAVVEIQQPDIPVRAGLSTVVRLSGKERKATIAPTIAVLSDGVRSYVFLVDEEMRVSVRWVETGVVTADGWTEISAGLSPGDSVVVYGQDALKAGDIVNTDWHEWSHR